MKKFIAPVLGLVAVIGLLSFDTSFAQMIDPGDRPTNLTGDDGGSLKTALRTVLNFFLFFLGIVATGMLIYGGFLYITSGGDDSGAEKGKKIIIYAAIGAIIILISFAIVKTLLQANMTSPTL